MLGEYGVFDPPALPALAWTVALVELVLSIWLFTGRALAAAALASLALHLIYACWSGVNLRRGARVENCGCFGVYFPRPLSGWTVAEDLLLASLSGALWRTARGSVART